MIGNSTEIKGTQKTYKPSLGINSAHSLGELLPVTDWLNRHLQLPLSALVQGERWQYLHSTSLFSSDMLTSVNQVMSEITSQICSVVSFRPFPNTVKS